MTTVKQGSRIWDHPEPPPTTSPSPLSRPGIVVAGIRLADAGGLSEVSIRKVASELGAGPMRLYRFVPSKDDLLDLMVDHVYAEIAAGLGSTSSWRESLREIALGYRASSFKHEWFVDLLGGRPHVGPHALTVLEATGAAILRAPRDFTTSELWSALGAVNAYLFGAIRSDVIDPGPGASGSGQFDNGQLDNNDLRPYLRQTLTGGNFPVLRRLVDEAARPDLEEDFIWGLNLVLDGLTATARAEHLR